MCLPGKEMPRRSMKKQRDSMLEVRKRRLDWARMLRERERQKIPFFPLSSEYWGTRNMARTTPKKKQKPIKPMKKAGLHSKFMFSTQLSINSGSRLVSEIAVKLS